MKLMTITQYAESTNLNKNCIRSMLGKIVATKINGRWYIDVEASNCIIKGMFKEQTINNYNDVINLKLKEIQEKINERLG